MSDNFFPNLCAAFNSLLHTNPRQAAEILFAQTVIKHRRGQEEVAKSYAERCLQLIQKLNIQTEEEAIAKFSPSINHVSIPEYFHEGTVLRRFQAIGLEL